MNASARILNLDTIELHYWLREGSHTMNALIFNRCEYEFLGIANELAILLNNPLDIEVEPIGEGGIRAWFKFAKADGKTIKVAFFVFFITQVLFAPLTTSCDFLLRKAWESFFQDKELKELLEEKEKESLKQEIMMIRAETERLCDSIDENKIKKRRSNFFEEASKCNKIEKISVCSTMSDKTYALGQQEVLAQDFNQYIMTSNDLDPEFDDNATIEIISPVLKNGKYQWLGIYNDAVIQFKMNSNDFKSMVLTGKVPFKNGSSIICQLITYKKIDNQGNVKIKGFEVASVYSFFDNGTPIETPEGRRKRHRKDAEERQMNLFSDAEYN